MGPFLGADTEQLSPSFFVTTHCLPNVIMTDATSVGKNELISTLPAKHDNFVSHISHLESRPLILIFDGVIPCMFFVIVCT